MTWLVFAEQSTAPPREWFAYLVMLLAAGGMTALTARQVVSSVARKYLMGLTGLFWCLFLVVHLGGNLLMYMGADVYNAYATALHRQEWLVKGAEFVLLYLLVLHIYLALGLTKDNVAARGPAGYRQVHTKRADRLLHGPIKPDYRMLLTGIVVLAFLGLHLTDFTLHARPDIAYEGQPYEIARAVLSTGLTIAGYTLGVIFLGFHVAHGFQSAFQSLGLNDPRLNRQVRMLGLAFAWIITLGFLSFPLLGLFGYL